MDFKTIPEAKEILRKLRATQEQHKNDKTPTFGVCISDMARDAGDAIESLLIFSAKKQFPILGANISIPWGILEPHEAQARANHGGQTLERLAERGGLCWIETLAVIEDRPWSRMDEVEAKHRVLQIIGDTYASYST